MGEAALWSWSEAAGKAHLEVRAATRGEGPVVRIDGPVARADRDWIYWRLPTVVTAEAFDGSRPEASRCNVRPAAVISPTCTSGRAAPPISPRRGAQSRRVGVKCWPSRS